MISNADCHVFISFPPLQAPYSCHSQHEIDDACLVSWRDERDGFFSSTLGAIVSLETTIGSRIGIDNTAIVSVDFLKHSPLHVCRFDLMGLSPDSPEDESGIKKAAENSESNVLLLVHTVIISALKEKAVVILYFCQ